MKRREFLVMATIGIARLRDARLKPRAPGTNVGTRAAQTQDGTRGFTRALLERATGYAVDVNGARIDAVALQREWNGAYSICRIVNRGPATVRVKEVVLLELPMVFAPETALYGEGFQMLTQTGGTIAQPLDYSQDRKSTRL